MNTPLVHQPDSTSSQVLIRGRLYPYKDKAPFVLSGVSVLGAIEYHHKLGMRCHECGGWFRHLAGHLKAHSTTARKYKSTHGLLAETPLIHPDISIAIGKHSRMRNQVKRATVARSEDWQERAHTSRIYAPKQHSRRNELGSCQVQILFRLRVAASQLGRAPTTREVSAFGLHAYSIRHAFGGIPWDDLLRLAGVDDIQIEERMPWPNEYGDTNDNDVFRRRSHDTT